MAPMRAALTHGELPFPQPESPLCFERGPLSGLSIVVPALDEAAELPDTLAALAPWRAAGAEVIVVDGGSSDGTRQLANRAADLVVLAPRGRAAQMNCGAAMSLRPWLLFLHADTRPEPGALETLAEALGGDGIWGRFDVRLPGRHPLFPFIARLIGWRSRLTGIATGDQGIFVRRVVFEDVGGFPLLPLMEDLALSQVLRRRDRPLCLKARLRTSTRRWERHGVLRTVLRMWALRGAWMAGVSAKRLAGWYAPR
jgi:rSAM/selenodomain-associated transferase 2